MASLADRLFAPFEGTRDPVALAVFRIAFFGGLALHFFPALIRLDDAYALGAVRTDEWSHWLYLHFHKIPRGWLRAGSILTMTACVAGLAGVRPRIAAAVAGVGLYAFASFNGLPVQTLALLDGWGILLLWMICGGGGGALSLERLLRRRPRAPEPRLLPALILYQVLLAVFFSGVEKLLAGWPGANQMGILLSYPRGFLVRDWVAASDWLRAPAVGWTLTWLTVVVELAVPPLLLVRRTRLAALAAYQLFFLGIIAMLEVPPLFYLIFAAGALLALDDADLARIRGARRRRGRTAAPGSSARSGPS